MKKSETEPLPRPVAGTGAPPGLELRRCREGVRLTAAGTVLLEAARDVLSAADHAVSQTRQAAGLGRPQLRFVIPADLPESLAVQVTSRLRSAAEAGEAAITWMDTALDGEFSPVRQRRADAGLGWLTASPGALPAPLETMSLGQFEPDAWIPSWHPAARSAVISLDELASMDIIHGPRRASPAIYDRWLQALQAADPRLGFTDPPVRHRRHDPGQHRRPPADRHRRPGMERRPAPPAPADPVRHRRQRDPAARTLAARDHPARPARRRRTHQRTDAHPRALPKLAQPGCIPPLREADRRDRPRPRPRTRASPKTGR
jgi:hypothetical protein